MALLGFFLQVVTYAAISTFSYFLWVLVSSPIKNIPGPLLAKCTNLWRFFDTYGGRPELTHRLLHEKYGAAVRIGPNVVSLNDPKLLRIIYNTRGDYLKVFISLSYLHTYIDRKLTIQRPSSMV